MSGPQFFQTPMGKKYYESTMPRIAKSLEDIAKHMKKKDTITDPTERAIIDNYKKEEQMSSKAYRAMRANKPFERVMDGKDDLDTNIAGILLLFKETLIQRGNWVDIITLRDATREIKALIARFNNNYKSREEALKKFIPKYHDSRGQVCEMPKKQPHEFIREYFSIPDDTTIGDYFFNQNVSISVQHVIDLMREFAQT